MTEAAFQEARKVMQKANYLRGIITKYKGEVAKWTKIEDVHRKELREAQANGAKKMLDKSLDRLKGIREKFAALQFPDPDLKVEKKETVQCEGCGCQIAKGNTYCGECLCEDDCDYL